MEPLTHLCLLFKITKLWKQPRCPTTDECVCDTYTIEFCSVIKKNEIILFAGKWMELENIMLSKISKAQKIKGCIFSLICGS
jgi:hypothetical protein